MIDERELIAKLENWAKESREESGLKEPALLRKVMDEVKDMAVNEEIRRRIEREDSIMTLEEAITHAREKAYELNDGICSREHFQLAGWLEELRQYRDKTEKEDASDRWIPVSEKLPEETYVLVSFKNSSMPDIGRYETDGEGGAFYPGDDEKSYKGYGLIVNAWMPLPEPYRGGIAE